MNEYKKLFASHYKCPICGKLNCKHYGSSKEERKILNRKIRTKLKSDLKENKYD